MKVGTLEIVQFPWNITNSAFKAWCWVVQELRRQALTQPKANTLVVNLARLQTVTGLSYTSVTQALLYFQAEGLLETVVRTRKKGDVEGVVTLVFHTPEKK